MDQLTVSSMKKKYARERRDSVVLHKFSGKGSLKTNISTRKDRQQDEQGQNLGVGIRLLSLISCMEAQKTMQSENPQVSL